mmetsp:Transcript_22047/g.59466  ORF Transcript_22047/g.59466 Transcript_22047/m.59466 type:complete len:139 (+) Transcript_22047:457-873(+)
MTSRIAESLLASAASFMYAASRAWMASRCGRRARAHLQDPGLVERIAASPSLRQAVFAYFARAYATQYQQGGPVPVPQEYLEKDTMDELEAQDPAHKIKLVLDVTGKPEHFMTSTEVRDELAKAGVNAPEDLVGKLGP